MHEGLRIQIALCVRRLSCCILLIGMTVQDNTMMAGADEFHMEIQGRGGHGRVSKLQEVFIAFTYTLQHLPSLS